MTWRILTTIFLFGLLVNLSMQHCAEYFSTIEWKVQYLTQNVTLAKAKQPQHFLNCTVLYESKKSEYFGNILTNCLENNITEEMCDGETSQKVSFYNFMCILARSLDFRDDELKETGCQYSEYIENGENKNICQMHSDLLHFANLSTTAATTTLQETTKIPTTLRETTKMPTTLQETTNISTTTLQETTNIATTTPQETTNISTTTPQETTNISTTTPQETTNISTTTPQETTFSSTLSRNMTLLPTTTTTTTRARTLQSELTATLTTTQSTGTGNNAVSKRPEKIQGTEQGEQDGFKTKTMQYCLVVSLALNVILPLAIYLRMRKMPPDRSQKENDGSSQGSQPIIVMQPVTHLAFENRDQVENIQLLEAVIGCPGDTTNCEYTIENTLSR